MRAFLAATIFCLAFGTLSPAHADWASEYGVASHGYHERGARVERSVDHRSIENDRHYVAAGDPRLARWCGWFMRQILHVADRRYNLAANWAHYGRDAGGPRRNVIVVWWHHVGQIVGECDADENCLVLSGNDGNRVRTRILSVRRAIAFREI